MPSASGCRALGAADVGYSSGSRLGPGSACRGGSTISLICLNYDVEFASEEEMAHLFPDCEAGAVPALGDPYRVATLVDDSLLLASKVYMEGGDHKTLFYLVGDDFRDLVGKAPHARFGVHS